MSCDEPPEEDVIMAYGEIGCGGYLAEPIICFGIPATMQTTWGQIKSIYR